MKNVIIAVIALFVTVDAFAASPVQEAKAKEWLSHLRSMHTQSVACNYANKYELLELGMDFAYMVAGAKDDMDRTIVDMWWTSTSLDIGYKMQASYDYMRLNPKDPQVIKLCKQDVIPAVDSVFNVIKTKMKK